MPGHTPKERKKKAKRDSRTEAAFHEVEHDEPSIVGKTRRKFGAARAEAQKTAIALSKARKAGAKIPFPKGGKRPHGSGPFTNADLAQGYKSL